MWLVLVFAKIVHLPLTTISIGTLPDFVLRIRRLEIPRSVTFWDPVTFISFNVDMKKLQNSDQV